MAGRETKNFWHSPELGSLLYSLYKIPLAQACFALARPNFHLQPLASGQALVSQPVWWQLIFVSEKLHVVYKTA